MDISAIRALFPVTRNYAYLNHASVAALPLPVTNAMNRYLTDRSLRGSDSLTAWDTALERIRQAAAAFIGAGRDEIVFTSSISHGLNIVAAGLDWQPGDNLICAETEFTANVYPWTNLRRRGVEVRFAPACDQCILLDDLAGLMDERTRLVALSFVEFGTGYRNNLDALAELCQSHRAYLCVDSIQGLGALAFSVAQTPVDFLAAHAAKWLLGPIGAGFLYIRRELVTQLDPVMTGWRAVVDRDDYYKYDSPLRDSGERFEPGSPNVVGLLGMEAALGLLQSQGLAEIEARILALTGYLIARLDRLGYEVISPRRHQHQRSGIVCFRHPVHPAQGLADRLYRAGVLISLRGDVIRVSPHYYNTEDELDRLLNALPR
jgi:selenocysteine lyase/cysteine desulfurase